MSDQDSEGVAEAGVAGFRTDRVVVRGVARGAVDARTGLRFVTFVAASATSAAPSFTKFSASFAALASLFRRDLPVFSAGVTLSSATVRAFARSFLSAAFAFSTCLAASFFFCSKAFVAFSPCFFSSLFDILGFFAASFDFFGGLLPDFVAFADALFFEDLVPLVVATV